ncbi:MAG: T9SS type A sorting domain-containing protein [Ignavibacteria bacterium]
MNAILRLLVLVLLPIACIQAQIPSYVPLNGLNGYWPLTGDANDVSGNGNNGTIYGPLLTNGKNDKVNSAYQFDGQNDFIQFLNPMLGGQQVSSFSLFFRFKKDNNDYMNLWGKSLFWGEIYVQLMPDKTLELFWANSNGGNKYSVGKTLPNTIIENNWYDLIINYENSKISIYLNGVESITQLSLIAQGGSVLSTNQVGDLCNFEQDSASNMLAPYSSFNQNTSFKGIIDEFGIWNRALTQQEITALYNSGIVIDTIPIIPTVKTVSTVSCFGGNDGIATVTHEGGIGPYTYVWNTTPVQTTQTATNLSAGTYFVTVKDSRDSIATASITITQPPAITNVIASVTKNVDCFGESGGSASVSNPTGGTPPYTYSWNTVPEQKTQQSIDLKAGNYTVTVTDSKGCIAQSNVTITQPNSAVEVASTIVENQVSCYGFSDGIISVPTPIGGTPPYTIVWNTQPVRYTERLVGVAAGTYTAVVVDSKGCIAETFISVGQPAEVVVESPKDTVVLIQTNAIFAAGTNNERTAYQWQTNLGTGFQDIQDIFQYLGTKTPVLNVLNCTLFNHNQPFRCILSTNGCYDTTDIATLSIRTNVSVDESTEVAGISISPNPTGESDQFLVHFTEIPNQDVSIELLDILGSIHYSNTLQAGSESCTIPVQGLNSGMYMLRVRMNSEVFVEKVIVN